MLTELLVRDLGVIDELSLVLDGGMTVVTGETGAGKTLIGGAIDLLTGGRADASLVRPGATEAEIQGRFEFGDDELVVRRVISREGRSRVYINGHLATVSALAEQGVDLIDLHGQHAHQSLLKTAVQRSALDRFGGIDTAPLASVLDELRAAESSLAELGGDARARAAAAGAGPAQGGGAAHARRADGPPGGARRTPRRAARLPRRPPPPTLGVRSRRGLFRRLLGRERIA